MRFRSVVAWVALAACLAFSCALPTGNTGGTPPVFEAGLDAAPSFGVFMDAEVSGVAYQCSPSGLSGLTDESGRYRYLPGDSVTFSLGGIALNDVPVTAAAVLTPVDLAGAAAVIDDDTAADAADVRATNIVRLLMALDSDGDPANGLSVSAEARTAIEANASGLSLALDEPTFAGFATTVATVIAAVESATSTAITVPPAAEAKTHFDLGLITPILSLRGGPAVSGTVVTVSAAGQSTAFTYSLDGGAWLPYDDTGIDVTGPEGATVTLAVRGNGEAATERSASYDIVALRPVVGLAVKDLATRQLILSWERPAIGDVVVSGTNGLGEVVVPNEYTSVKINLAGVNVHEMSVTVRSAGQESAPLRFVVLALPKINLEGRYDFSYDASGRVALQKIYYADNYLLGVSMVYADAADRSPDEYGVLPLGLSFGGDYRAALQYNADERVERVSVANRGKETVYAKLAYGSKGVASCTLGSPTDGDIMRFDATTDSSGNLLQGNVWTFMAGVWFENARVGVSYSGGVVDSVAVYMADGTPVGSMGISRAGSAIKFAMTGAGTTDTQYSKFRHDESSAYFDMTSGQVSGGVDTPSFRSLMYYNDRGQQVRSDEFQYDAGSWNANGYSTWTYDGAGLLTLSESFDEFGACSYRTTFGYVGDVLTLEKDYHDMGSGLVLDTEQRYSSATGNITDRIEYDSDGTTEGTHVYFDPDTPNKPLTRVEQGYGGTFTRWNENASGVIVGAEVCAGTVWDAGAIIEIWEFGEPSNDYWNVYRNDLATRVEFFESGELVRLVEGTYGMSRWNRSTATYTNYEAGSPTRVVSCIYGDDGDIVSATMDLATQDSSGWDGWVATATSGDPNYAQPGEMFWGATEEALAVVGVDLSMSSTSGSSTWDPVSLTLSAGGKTVLSAAWESSSHDTWLSSATYYTVSPVGGYDWKVTRGYDGDGNQTSHQRFCKIGGVWVLQPDS